MHKGQEPVATGVRETVTRLTIGVSTFSAHILFWPLGIVDIFYVHAWDMYRHMLNYV